MHILPRFFGCLLGIVVYSGFTYAENHITVEHDAQRIVSDFYSTYSKKQPKDITQRVVLFSELLLDRPYVLFPLGEGRSGEFDQAPLYRMDAFDCETYIDSVLALAFGEDLNSFKRYITQIRYKKGRVSFIDRNHFSSLDWNTNNQREGFVRDVTVTILDERQKPVALYADALVDKPSWYNHFSVKNIRVHGASERDKENRLTALKRAGLTLPKEVARIPYIPLSALFDEQGNPNKHIFKQIPQAAIVEIVRPNWDLSKAIGTHLNVSHSGFAVWKDGVLYYRNASSITGKTMDTPMVDYLLRARKSPTIRGINVQVVLPSQEHTSV